MSPVDVAVPAVHEGWSIQLDDYVSAARWAPDGSLVAAASLAGEAWLFDAADGTPLRHLPSHPLGVLALAWSPDGAVLAVGGQDGVLRLVDRAGDVVSEVVLGGWVSALAWSHASGLLGAAAGTEVLLVEPGGEVVGRWDDHVSTVTSLAWSADGSRLGAGAYGGVLWFEPEVARTRRRFTWKGSVLAMAVSPDGRWAVTGNQDSSVHVWPLWSGDELQMSGYPSKVHQLAFRHDSARLAVGSIGDVTIWDFSGKGPGGRGPKVLTGHLDDVAALAYQHRGDLLASGAQDGRLVLWQPDAGTRPLRVLEDGGLVCSLAWAPDDRRLLVGGADGALRALEVG